MSVTSKEVINDENSTGNKYLSNVAMCYEMYITVLHAAARQRPQEVPPPVALTEASRQPPRRGQQLRAGDGGQVQPPALFNVRCGYFQETDCEQEHSQMMR